MVEHPIASSHTIGLIPERGRARAIVAHLARTELRPRTREPLAASGVASNARCDYVRRLGEKPAQPPVRAASRPPQASKFRGGVPIKIANPHPILRKKIRVAEMLTMRSPPDLAKRLIVIVIHKCLPIVH